MLVYGIKTDEGKFLTVGGKIYFFTRKSKAQGWLEALREVYQQGNAPFPRWEVAECFVGELA